MRWSRYSEVVTPLAPGLEVERYAIERILGEGGHATVYQVRHVELGVVRALKVLHGSDATLASRLVTEGRILAQLQHPNVVAVYDVLRVDGSPALVMEFVGGGSLDDVVGDASTSLDEIERLFREVCAGVSAAHRAGIVHRDLKPSNVLLDDTATPRRAKVADFGIARVDDDQKAHHTRSSQGLGSPAYMAPEQGRDAASADARADVWGLGALLYALLAGRPPFQGGAWWEVLAAAAAGKRLPVTTYRPDAPPEMVALIDACLRPAVAERPPDIATVLAILDGASWNPGPAPRPASAGATMDWDDAEAPEAGTPAEGEAASGPGAPSVAEAVTPAGTPLPVDAQRAAPPATGDDVVAMVREPARPGATGPGVATALVVDVTGRGHAVEVVVTLRPGDGTVWTPTDAARDAQVAAQAAAAAALGPELGAMHVTWQVRGVGFRLEGTSMGLALAVACASARAGRAVPPGWCFTGGVDIDGRIAPVAGVPAKVAAAAASGAQRVVIPAGGMPASVPPAVLIVEAARLSDVLAELFRSGRRDRVLHAAPIAAALAVGPLLALLDAGSMIDVAVQYPVLRAAGRAVALDDVVVVDLPPVDDLRSLRAEYPALLRRLAAAGASVAVLDVTLTARTEHDEAFAAAVAEVAHGGLRVIAPARVDGDRVARPESEALVSALSLGHAVSLRDLSVGWVRRAPVAVHDEQGLRYWHVAALAAAAAVGGQEPRVDGGALVTGPLRSALDRSAFALAPAGEVTHVAAEGDLAATSGKVAVVGVVREGTDLHATADGTRYGAEILAIEVQTLLRQAAPRRVPLEADAVAALIAGGGAWVARHRWWVAPGIVVVVLALGVLLAAGGLLSGTVAPVVAVAAATLLARWRGRHGQAQRGK